MSAELWVLGEALMDCVAQPDGDLRPFLGGSPFNMARAAALCGAEVGYLNPISSDLFGDQIREQLERDGVRVLLPASPLPTSLAVVQLSNGQPRYGFYRDGIADRDYSATQVLERLSGRKPGVLHTGSLMLVPPEAEKVITILRGARKQGWTISVDVNLRGRLAADVGKYVAAVNEVSALADWIKASDEDLQALGLDAPSRANASQLAGHFRTMGARRIALTFGEKGAWLEVNGVVAEQDVPKTGVVDTVGAGDTFWGNCVGDWVINLLGAELRVATTLDRAMRAAAINCTRAGCQPPTYDELMRHPG